MIMNNIPSEYNSFEPTAKIMAANALAESLSFCFERKYLANITSNNLFQLKVKPSVIGQ